MAASGWMRFSATSGGAVYYKLPIHPSVVSWEDSPLFDVLEVRDGPPVIQRPLADPRLRTMTWTGWRPTYTTFETMLQVLRSYKAATKWFKETVTTSPVFSVWVKVRVLGVSAQISPGGPVRYDNVTVSLVIIDPNFTAF